MIGRGRSWAAAALVASIVAAALPVAAHDHQPPPTYLEIGAKRQKGRLGTHCWTTAGGEPSTYSRICIDTLYSWPRALWVRGGRSALVFIGTPYEPEGLAMRAYRRVDESGFPTGSGRRVDFSLRPRMDDEGAVVGYDARFTLPRGRRHFYLLMFGRWTDQEGSGQSEDAEWTFHLRLTS